MRKVLIELGYDPNTHRSQGVSLELLDWADKVVVMGNAHIKFLSTYFPVFMNKVENWNIKDPHFEPGCEVHKQVAIQIRDRILTQFF